MDEVQVCRTDGHRSESKDSEASHQKFREKFALPFPLIADTELELAQAFGVFGEKKFMGKVYDGIHRMSFLIDADGTILKTYAKVKPDEHADTVQLDLHKRGASLIKKLFSCLRTSA